MSYFAIILVTAGTLPLLGTFIPCQLQVLQWLQLLNVAGPVAGYVKLSISSIKVSDQSCYYQISNRTLKISQKSY